MARDDNTLDDNTLDDNTPQDQTLDDKTLQGVDLSHIDDEDLSPQEKDELARRFKKFFRVLDEESRKKKTGKKTLRQWVPGQDS